MDNTRAGNTIIKTFSLYPEDLDIINEVNDKLGLRASSSDALRYILQEWKMINTSMKED